MWSNSNKPPSQQFFCLATIQSNGVIATPTLKFPIPFIYSIIYACHVISRPRPSKMSTSVTSNVTTCPLCSVSIASVRSYVSHIRLSHYKNTDLDLTCNIDGCTAVFNTFSAFNSLIQVEAHIHSIPVGMGRRAWACK